MVLGLSIVLVVVVPINLLVRFIVRILDISRVPPAFIRTTVVIATPTFLGFVVIPIWLFMGVSVASIGPVVSHVIIGSVIAIVVAILRAQATLVPVPRSVVTRPFISRSIRAIVPSRFTSRAVSTILIISLTSIMYSMIGPAGLIAI
ncbi:uncharacterized protein CIMG_12702 [Coccidioides immitis RS]|uniref:Uncharacterized protein n=1 Tax=Coccidioides immitis (strain RS) TaxID=246410 RepID=A0A0D8JST4_COCIM|nr:uncharacterized protein CIMG_12702 [Coccidioides immitis RS]KJF60041.1 hypothetical protein CIMG_12702 [Coccidioides immitis RS]